MNRKLSPTLLVYSLLFGIINFSCYSIVYCWDNGISSSTMSLPYTLLIILLIALIVYLLMHILSRLQLAAVLLEKERSGSSLSNRTFLLSFVLQSISWLLVLLVYYPGITAYDYTSQILQVTDYSSHHPLSHTLYVQFFYYILGGRVFSGNYRLGVFIGTLIQLLVFSAMISFSHSFIAASGIRKPFRYLLLAYTCLFPFFSVIAISNTKDVLFTGFICVAFTCLCSILMPNIPFYSEKTISILYICSIAGSILFRKNGMIPFLAVLALAILLYRNKRLIKITLVGIIIGECLSVALSTGLHAERGSVNEALSVPIQQLSYTYHEHSADLTKEEVETLLTILPDIELYQPMLADPVKETAATGNHISEFIKIYFSLGLRYPMCYVNSFLHLNGGYLCVANIRFDRTSSGLVETTEGAYESVSPVSMIPQLYDLSEEVLAGPKLYRNIPVFRILARPGLYFWFIMALLSFAIIKKAKVTLLPFAFLLSMIATYLLGPCALVRYALCFIVCIPGLVATLANSTT